MLGAVQFKLQLETLAKGHEKALDTVLEFHSNSPDR
jgi:hypothetical protein